MSFHAVMVLIFFTKTYLLILKSLPDSTGKIEVLPISKSINKSLNHYITIEIWIKSKMIFCLLISFIDYTLSGLQNHLNHLFNSNFFVT